MEGRSPPTQSTPPAGVPSPTKEAATGTSELPPTRDYVGGPGPLRGLAVISALILLIWALATRVETGADTMVQKLGRLEVTARLVERPDQFPKLGAYRYTYVLKYKVVSVHRQDPEGKHPLKAGDEIFVGHYKPWLPRSDQGLGLGRKPAGRQAGPVCGGRSPPAGAGL